MPRPLGFKAGTQDILWSFGGFKPGLDNSLVLSEPFWGTSVEPFYFLVVQHVCILQDGFFPHKGFGLHG